MNRKKNRYCSRLWRMMLFFFGPNEHSTTSTRKLAKMLLSSKRPGFLVSALYGMQHAHYHFQLVAENGYAGSTSYVGVASNRLLNELLVAGAGEIYWQRQATGHHRGYVANGVAWLAKYKSWVGQLPTQTKSCILETQLPSSQKCGGK